MGNTTPANIDRWATGLALASFALFCALLASLWDVWRAERATQWPTTDGTIVESWIGGGCGRSGTGFRVRVRYTYTVDGTAYQDQRILFGASTCYSRSGAKAFTDQFPVSAVVKVGYDPKDPAEAVLIPGKVDDSTRGAIAFFTLWFVLAAAATGMAVYAARSQRNPRPGLPPQRALGKPD